MNYFKLPYLLFIGSIGIILFTILLLSLVYSSTNYSSLDDLQVYVENYGSEENKIFNDINIALKVMPTYNTEKNALFMTHSNEVLF